MWVGVGPGKHLHPVVDETPVGGGPLERADAGAVDGGEEIDAYVVGREVEHETVILLVDEESPDAVGQQEIPEGHGDPVPARQDVDPVVGVLDESRVFHDLSPITGRFGVGWFPSTG